ncbi:unnamed protein product (macronuclear) [Paramecium tetraurelia]|uniref:Uncharacterized protein n=1 Tax=Paramecium tetraurelia TaxID=5888 RepID=A0DSM4_PARTE|nr:uncharacterized protein GSPATT00039747001 [Paramecium tetraurelia]CAK86041.1 unnamed protein product [Paramecium tetraurelia]|eukprot:XP_001453438.1 hypothetical protein (macronuclear) [Paramecium tetraurelia strain d4-2]
MAMVTMHTVQSNRNISMQWVTRQMCLREPDTANLQVVQIFGSLFEAETRRISILLAFVNSKIQCKVQCYRMEFYFQKTNCGSFVILVNQEEVQTARNEDPKNKKYFIQDHKQKFGMQRIQAPYLNTLKSYLNINFCLEKNNICPIQYQNITQDVSYQVEQFLPVILADVQRYASQNPLLFQSDYSFYTTLSSFQEIIQLDLSGSQFLFKNCFLPMKLDSRFTIG